MSLEITMMTRAIDEAVELLRDPNLVWGAAQNTRIVINTLRAANAETIK